MEFERVVVGYNFRDVMQVFMRLFTQARSGYVW